MKTGGMTTTDTNHVSINSLPWHTATEIVQQPWVWEKTYHLIKERKKEIQEFLT